MRAFRLVVLSCFVLLVAGLLVIGVGLRSTQASFRQAQRGQDLEKVANYLERFLRVTKTLPLGIDAEWRQIGTGKDRCQLSGVNCQVTADECLDLHYLTQEKVETLPADLLSGSHVRTGYAVRLLDQHKIEVAACGAEAVKGKITQLDIPGEVNRTPSASSWDKFVEAWYAQVL